MRVNHKCIWCGKLISLYLAEKIKMCVDCNLAWDGEGRIWNMLFHIRPHGLLVVKDNEKA